MSRIIIGMIALLAFSFSDLQAQRKTEYADVYWGKEYKEPPKSLITNVIGTDAEGFYAVRQRGRVGRPYLEHYYHNMDLRQSREMELSYKGKYQELEDIIFYNDELYMLTSYNNEQKNTNYLFMQGVFKKTLTQKGDIRVVGEIPARNRNNEGNFDFRISPDSTHFLMYYGMPYKANEAERFQFKVYDDKMEPVWTKEIALPYSDQLFTVEEFRVDDKGNVYLLGRNYFEKFRDRKKGKPNYQYIILAYFNQGEEVKQYKVSFEDKFISDLTFRIANNGDLICGGFYSDRSSFNMKGTCFFRINAATSELYNTGTKEFDQDFLSLFMTDKQAKKGRELYEYDLNRLIMRSDGGAVLIAEQYFQRIFTRQDFFTGIWEETRYYYYNDIIVVNINPDGSVAWVSKIPKRQVTTNDGGYFSSYSMAIVRDKLFFMFNDHPANALEKNPTRLRNYNGKSSVVTLAVIKSSGEYDKYALFSNRDADIITRPKISKQSDRDEMIIYGERNKNYKFGLLKFK